MSKYYVELEDVIQRLDNAIYEANRGALGYDEALKRLRVAYSETMPTIEVSEDCISRAYLKSFEYINKGDFNSVETIREWIDNAPSVVPKPKEGEWITQVLDTIYGRQIRLECPKCGDVFNVTEKAFAYEKYCRYCGAKMK